MANKTITELSSIVSADLASGDLIHVVDISESADADKNKSLVVSELDTRYLGADVDIAGKTGKTTPVAADTFLIDDSAASNVNKKVTFANLGTALSAGIVGGSDTQLQYNNSGAFGATTRITYNSASDQIIFADASTAQLKLHVDGKGYDATDGAQIYGNVTELRLGGQYGVGFYFGGFADASRMMFMGNAFVGIGSGYSPAAGVTLTVKGLTDADLDTTLLVTNSSDASLLSVRDDGLVTFNGLVYPTSDGSDGQVITTDGAGNLAFESAAGGGSPGGSDTHVQINDGGVFFGESTFAYNKATNVLTVASLDITNNIVVGGTVDGIDIATDVAANTAHLSASGASHSYIDQDVTNGANVTFGNIAGTLTTAAQAGVTSVGTLTSLAVTNNITVGGTVDGRDVATDGTKLDYATITQAVDLDQLEADSHGQVEMCYLKDVQTQATDGGGFTQDQWQVRVFNVLNEDGSESNDGADFCTLSSNEFTLDGPGKYYMEFFAPAYSVLDHKCRVYDETNTAIVSIGSNDYLNSGAHGSTIVRCTVTIAGDTTYSLEDYCTLTDADNGLGHSNDIPSTVEIYANGVIYKLA